MTEVVREGMNSGYLREDDPSEIVFEIGALFSGLVMLYLGGRMGASRARFRAFCRRSLRRHIDGIRG